MKIELFESFQKLKILEPKAKADIELINTNDKVPHRSPFEYMKISVHATSVENFDNFSVPQCAPPYSGQYDNRLEACKRPVNLIKTSDSMLLGIL